MTISVSILMPMRNAEAYIKETVQSLLNQSFSDFEIIVVNDGSDDKSQALVESFSDARIKIVQGESAGISVALNLALSHAQGRYVCRCDADDLYPLDRLQVQVDWLEAHPEYIAVAGKFSSMDEKSHVIAEFNTGNETCEITSELLSGKTRTHLGAFLMSLSIVNQLQGFREYFVTAEDIDMQLRLAECGRVAYIPQNMYFYRIHNDSITHVQSSNKRIFYENIARCFLKQRLERGADALEKGMPPQVPTIAGKPSDSTDQIVGYMIAESWRLHREKKKGQALAISIRACVKKPLAWRGWKNIIMILVKR
ncbi:MAG: glycosyltransferase [Cycloclasticus sp.]|nr:glycosyltransferase [Cycloclasticus sp.]